MPRLFVASTTATANAQQAIERLNADGYWSAPLGITSHPYQRPGSKQIPPGDFSETLVGDDTDTSPYRDESAIGISTAAYIRHMSVLIASLG